MMISQRSTDLSIHGVMLLPFPRTAVIFCYALLKFLMKTITTANQSAPYEESIADIDDYDNDFDDDGDECIGDECDDCPYMDKCTL